MEVVRWQFHTRSGQATQIGCVEFANRIERVSAGKSDIGRTVIFYGQNGKSTDYAESGAKLVSDGVRSAIRAFSNGKTVLKRVLLLTAK